MNLLITGANRGLGYEIAAESLERGHTVIAGSRRPEDTDAQFASLAKRYGTCLTVVKLDVADEAGVAALALRLKAEGKALGAIVNNAAILEARNTHIENLDLDIVARTFDINLFGPMRVVKHFLPLLTEPNAAIVNISSEAGSITNAYPGDYPYALSKAALNMFTKQLFAYVKDKGIEVLSVHPGWMKTDMGGMQAPTNPRDSARGILDLIERTKVTHSSFRFVDYYGNEMPI